MGGCGAQIHMKNSHLIHWYVHTLDKFIACFRDHRQCHTHRKLGTTLCVSCPVTALWIGSVLLSHVTYHPDPNLIGKLSWSAVYRHPKLVECAPIFYFSGRINLFKLFWQNAGHWSYLDMLTVKFTKIVIYM